MGVNFNPRLSKAICDGVSTWSEQLIIFVSFAGLVEASSSEKPDHPCYCLQRWPQKWRFLALHLGVGTAHWFLHLNEPLREWAEVEDFDFFVLDFASDQMQLCDWKDQIADAAVAAAAALVAAAAALVAAAFFVVALCFAASVDFAVCFRWDEERQNFVCLHFSASFLHCWWVVDSWPRTSEWNLAASLVLDPPTQGCQGAYRKTLLSFPIFSAHVFHPVRFPHSIYGKQHPSFSHLPRGR